MTKRQKKIPRGWGQRVNGGSIGWQGWVLLSNHSIRFGLGNKNYSFQLHTLIWRPSYLVRPKSNVLVNICTNFLL